LLCNFSPDLAAFHFDPSGWELALATAPESGNPQSIPGYSAMLYVRSPR